MTEHRTEPAKPSEPSTSAESVETATQAEPADKTVETGLLPGTASRSLWGDAFYTLRRRVDVIIACLIALFFIVVAAFPTLFTKVDPTDCKVRDSKIPPQWFGGEHPFGTDTFGCDYLAMTVHGARPSLLLAFGVVGTSVVIGVVLGCLAGYYLGFVDMVISRMLEVFLVVPFLLAALLVLSMLRNLELGDNLLVALLPPAAVLTMFGWIAYARYVRASVLETKNLDYVRAAKALGASDRRIIFRHVLPNAVAPVTALIPTAVGGIIASEAVLAFLGVGLRPPSISWGVMISQGSQWAAGGYMHLLVIPLTCLMATILSFVVIGDALRDALDPKLR